MIASLSALGVAVVVFAATNIDDILLLSAFFADRALRVRAIVIGQFAGIGALTAASVAAALLAWAIPEGWVALLGLAPLSLGLRGAYHLWMSRGDEAESEEGRHAKGAGRSAHSQWIAVALVTMANGGDNLGVYIPMFTRDLALIPAYVLVFAIMTAIWCLVGYWLVNHPTIGARIRQYGHIALPIVLVGLGLHILSGARALLQ